MNGAMTWCIEKRKIRHGKTVLTLSEIVPKQRTDMLPSISRIALHKTKFLLLPYWRDHRGKSITFIRYKVKMWRRPREKKIQLGMGSTVNQVHLIYSALTKNEISFFSTPTRTFFGSYPQIANKVNRRCYRNRPGNS